MDRDVWTEATVASEEEDNPATVLYTYINSLNFIVLNVYYSNGMIFNYKYHHLDAWKTHLNTKNLHI